MRQLTQEQRLRTAKHEAGHALAFILKGIPFHHVWVGQGNCWFLLDDTKANGAVVPDRDSDLEDCYGDFTPQQREDVGVIMMAGLAGERIGRSCGSIWRGAKGNESAVRGTEGDIEDVVRCLELEGYDALDGWLGLAHALLTEHADAHRRLTDALVERGSLSYAACVALVELSAEGGTPVTSAAAAGAAIGAAA
jgi:hypothetical protein